MNDNTYKIYDLDDHKYDYSLEEVWSNLESDIFDVVNEYGENILDAKVRHLADDSWIMVDESSGYQIVNEMEVKSLNNDDRLILQERGE